MASDSKIEELQENFKRLFTEGLHSDIILRVEDREFPVHKGILSVRSPVFASMFKYGTIENEIQKIVIPDCSAEAFELFLLYLYSGTVGNITDENVFDLYYITDKYFVDELKKECLAFIKTNLSVENFGDVLELYVKHSELELQSLLVSFFFKNHKALKENERWQRFGQENPIIVSELIIQAFKSMRRYGC